MTATWHDAAGLRLSAPRLVAAAGQDPVPEYEVSPIPPRSITRELVLYALVSGAAFAVDFATLALLVELGGWRYLPAAAVAFIIGGLAAWVLSVRFVFRFRRVLDRRAEAIIFVALGLVGLAANMAVLAAGVEWLGLHYLVAKAGAGACTVTLNFALRRLVLFTHLSDTAAARTHRGNE